MSMRLKPIKKVQLGSLRDREIACVFEEQVTDENSLQYRVEADGVEMQVTLQVVGGVMNFMGSKPTPKTVVAAIEELYALAATGRPVKRDEVAKVERFSA